MKKTRAFTLSLTIATLAIGSAWSEKKYKGDDLSNMVVEGENRLKLKSGMPPLEWKVDPYAKLGDEFAFLRVYEELSPPQISKPPLVMPATYDSKRVATPWLTRIMTTPVLTLNIKTEENIEGASWNFFIKDSNGRVFYEERDRGYIPEDLVWDGRGANGDMLQLGRDYTYVFSVIDAAGNPTRKAGKAFRLDALRYREDGWNVIGFSPDVLFTDKTRAELSANGKLYMEEVKDQIAQYFDGAIHIRMYGRDGNLARSRATVIQRFFTEALTLNEDQFKVTLEDPSKGGGYEHVDIAVK